VTEAARRFTDIAARPSNPTQKISPARGRASGFIFLGAGLPEIPHEAQLAPRQPRKAPTLAAIVNGIIALIVAQFFRDHPVAKGILVTVVLLLGFVGVRATLYSHHKIVIKRNAEAAAKRAIHEALERDEVCLNLR
jgi:hypothetical protein